MEADGAFTLPVARARTGPKAPRRLEAPVPVPEAVPADVGAVQGLRLGLVTTAAQIRV